MEVAQTVPAPLPMIPAASDRNQQVFRVATELFNQAPDWVTFFREVLGVEGIVRKMFQTPEEMNRFEQSNEYQEIQQMLAKLREMPDGTPGEPQA